MKLPPPRADTGRACARRADPSGRGTGPEGSPSVIPFIADDDGSVLLLTRLNIDWVVVGADVEPLLIFPPDRAPTHEQRAELRFLDDRRVEVTLLWRPEDEADDRLSDFLNSGVEFVTARAGFGTLIVNKHRIRETRIAASVARAKAA